MKINYLATVQFLSIVAFLLPNLTHGQVTGITVITNAQILYEPFSGQPASEFFQVRIDISSEQNSEIGVTSTSNNDRTRLRIRPTANSSFNAQNDDRTALPIVLENNNDGGRLNFVNREYRYDFNLNQQTNSVIDLDFIASVAPSIFATPGVYVLALDIDLIDAISGEELVSGQLLELEILVEAKLQTNIAGTRSAAVDGVKLSMIDFGILETGESERVFIQIRGNARASITVSSENNGRLLLEQTSNNYIGYSVSVDGEMSTLETPLNLRRGVAQDLRGSSYPMDITIGDVKGAFAGLYKDLITVEVTPQ